MDLVSKGIDLQINNLIRSFGATGVLQGLNLEIGAGEFVIVLGKSGSGKSTLLRLIAGLDKPDEGTIQPGASNGPKYTARVMFQDARLLPWKRVLENVGLGLKQRDWQERAKQALAQVGLTSKAHQWPSVLSGGERQRVALARALVHEPDLLLLDEPLGALDALTRIEMQQLIETVWLNRGFTALMITHDVEEAVALGDRVVVIEQGRVGLELPVDLLRPRSRGSARFGALKETLLQRVLGNNAPPISVEKVAGEPVRTILTVGQ